MPDIPSEPDSSSSPSYLNKLGAKIRAAKFSRAKGASLHLTGNNENQQRNCRHFIIDIA
ncbi:MAG: hypothetical protein LC099_04810 [Anaerolineales bacterium]|nr:hypothetical protein [Anaerolineales bacterium]